ncbi:transposase family protein [Actinomadura nitritigenes]|uniref:transposase family protein n=1 Tax=Actinomadura nitritigenes TaxID=134602 RepID=UPI003D8F3E7A
MEAGHRILGVRCGAGQSTRLAARRAKHGHAVGMDLSGPMLEAPTLIAIDRAAADRPHYSGKHHHHRANLQVITAPASALPWVSRPVRGSVHDPTAARIRSFILPSAATGLPVLADKPHQGTGAHVLTPCKGHDKPEPHKDAKRAHAKPRAPAEQANTQLKSRRMLRNQDHPHPATPQDHITLKKGSPMLQKVPLKVWEPAIRGASRPPRRASGLYRWGTGTRASAVRVSPSRHGAQ